MIKAGAVAALGTKPTKGEMKAHKKKAIATNTDVKPVRPPNEIPTVDSAYTVVFEVPKTAPNEVPTTSPKSALSN